MRAPVTDERRPSGIEDVRVDLAITGMTCASCAVRVENRLKALDGVEANVNYATGSAVVRFDPAVIRVDDLVHAVESTGYAAELPGADHGTDPIDQASSLRRRLVVSAALSAPLALLAMVPPLQFTGWEWVALALADTRRPLGRLRLPPRRARSTPATARRRWTRWSRSATLAALAWSAIVRRRGARRRRATSRSGR